MAKEPKSPIKAKPLRNPGQSLDEAKKLRTDEVAIAGYHLSRFIQAELAE